MSLYLNCPLMMLNLYLAYNEKNTIVLLNYCPIHRLYQQLKIFKTTYDPESTMCAFNVNKAFVFGNNTLEYYCIDTKECKEFTTQMDSFHSEDFISVPFY